jgi:hypothetical protein
VKTDGSSAPSAAQEKTRLYNESVDRLEELKKFSNSFTGPFAKTPTPAEVHRLAACLYNVSAFAMAVCSPENPIGEFRGLLAMTELPK